MLHCLNSGGQISNVYLVPRVSLSSSHADSDDNERGSKKKVKKKKTTNLGPCIRVHEVKRDGSGVLEVKAYFETSKNNCVAFEFRTDDMDLDEITTTFVS